MGLFGTDFTYINAKLPFFPTTGAFKLPTWKNEYHRFSASACFRRITSEFAGKFELKAFMVSVQNFLEFVHNVLLLLGFTKNIIHNHNFVNTLQVLDNLL